MGLVFIPTSLDMYPEALEKRRPEAVMFAQCFRIPGVLSFGGCLVLTPGGGRASSGRPSGLLS